MSAFTKFIQNDGLVGILRTAFEIRDGAYYALVIAAVLICAVSAYLFGSINFAVVVSTKLYKTDIRTKGSKNAGMTNMFRVLGKKAGLLTLAGDVGKALIAGIIGYAAYGTTGAYISGFFCILGHILPCYYHFKGGKGVLTAAVMILILDPIVFAIVFLIFAIIVIGTRYVSLGSVMSALIYPLIKYEMATIFGGDGAVAGISNVFAILIGALIVFMHRSNIMRIYRGEENKITLPWQKKRAAREAAEREARERAEVLELEARRGQALADTESDEEPLEKSSGSNAGGGSKGKKKRK